jgi:hypothetical protein
MPFRFFLKERLVKNFLVCKVMLFLAGRNSEIFSSQLCSEHDFVKAAYRERDRNLIGRKTAGRCLAGEIH